MKSSSACDTDRERIRQTVPVTAISPHTAPFSDSATAEEAAAIAAALERFLHETTPAQTGSGELPSDPWTRAAMLEGVSREDHADVPHPWINT